MMNKYRFSWLGIFLIVIGGVLLLHRLNVLDIGFFQIFWPLIIVFGFAKVETGFSRNRRGRIFWGTVLFLYGLFFFLGALESVDVHWTMFFPASFLIVGIAFFMMFLNDVRNWYLVIPSILFGGIGAAFLLTEYGYFNEWEVREAVRLYWPIGLILLGVAFVFRRRPQAVADQPTPQ